MITIIVITCHVKVLYTIHPNELVCFYSYFCSYIFIKDNNLPFSSSRGIHNNFLFRLKSVKNFKIVHKMAIYMKILLYGGKYSA